jgi:hypothetical protein
MRQRFRPSHGTVVAYVALFIALGGTAVAATGGKFILGQSNSANQPTSLTSGAPSALKVTNTAGGDGLLASGGKRSKGTAAVHGTSGGGNAVEGFSTANPASGVFGQDNKANSYGVAGHSDNGVAVVGDSSNGWAMQALGNTTQARGKSGFVKAMAVIDPVDHPSDPIRRCFNSQRPASQAASGNCGISFSRGTMNAGDYDLTFNFEVDDRFFSTTAFRPADTIISAVTGPNQGPNTVRVLSYSAVLQSFNESAFYIVVY